MDFATGLPEAELVVLHHQAPTALVAVTRQLAHAGLEVDAQQSTSLTALSDQQRVLFLGPGQELARLLDSERMRNGIVAFTADHGESLGDHGEQSHGLFIYESTLHVPWVMAGPGVPAGE